MRCQHEVMAARYFVRMWGDVIPDVKITQVLSWCCWMLHQRSVKNVLLNLFFCGKVSCETAFYFATCEVHATLKTAVPRNNRAGLHDSCV